MKTITSFFAGIITLFSGLIGHHQQVTAVPPVVPISQESVQRSAQVMVGTSSLASIQNHSTQSSSVTDEKELTQKLNKLYHAENTTGVYGDSISLHIFYHDSNVIADWALNPKGGKCLSLVDPVTFTRINKISSGSLRICDALDHVIETNSYIIDVNPVQITYYKKGAGSISLVEESKLSFGSTTYASYESGLDVTIPASFATATKMLTVSIYRDDSGEPDYKGNKKLSDKSFILP
jgi:hypothetical protein